MFLFCPARTQLCQVESRIRKRREPFSRRGAHAKLRTRASLPTPPGWARNAPPPTCPASCPNAVQRPCCADAATLVLPGHPRKTAPRMPRRTGLDVPASFPSNQAAATSALRAYGSSAEGNVVAPSAISENSPAKQTAVIRKKWIPNQTTRMRFENISWDGRDGRPGRPSLSLHR